MRVRFLPKICSGAIQGGEPEIVDVLMLSDAILPTPTLSFSITNYQEKEKEHDEDKRHNKHRKHTVLIAFVVRHCANRLENGSDGQKDALAGAAEVADLEAFVAQQQIPTPQISVNDLLCVKI